LSKASILLVGAGGHSRACIDVIEQEGRFAVEGLVGLPDQLGSGILGYTVLGSDADLPALLPKHARALVTIGQIRTPEVRIRLFYLLQQTGYLLPRIVSPRAYVSPHSTLGEGTIVMHGAVVNAGAVVGRNCIVNSHALVEHDAVVEDHCHIATSTSINGGAHVGEGTFVGSCTSVRENVTIGRRSLIGMGQRVMADCGAETLMPPTKSPS
jgi:sugar O-acyltransferase (sialic acid O-acetyltransferase NeuD family)